MLDYRLEKLQADMVYAIRQSSTYCLEKLTTILLLCALRLLKKFNLKL